MSESRIIALIRTFNRTLFRFLAVAMLGFIIAAIPVTILWLLLELVGAGEIVQSVILIPFGVFIGWGVATVLVELTFDWLMGD